MEHPFYFSGAQGQLEAVLTLPEIESYDYIALLGHPHSLQGGSMNNKVVTSLARAFKESGIPSIRFNFRGVGQSEGVYDAGIGESEDMLLLRQQWADKYPKARFLIAGFSFGSYVAYRTAAQSEADLLITVAPAVHHYNYAEFSPPTRWYIVQGDQDEVVPATLVEQFAEQFSPPLPIIHFADTGHFFHGKLLALKAELTKIIERVIA